MKTKLLFLGLTLSVFTPALSQPENAWPKIVETFPSFVHDVRKYTEIDTAKYVITYSVKAIINPVKYPTDTLTEKLALQIGNRMSKSFNLTLFEGDSIFFYEYEKGKSGLYKQHPIVPVEIYRNYPKGDMTSVYRLTKYNFRYKENYPIEFSWQLHNEKKKILNYNCQKATCSFRGRNYIAWFTPEIPLKEGPYKFGGLPGLILQISDEKNEYIFTCIGIRKPKTVLPIKLFKWEYKDMTREKLNAYLVKVHKNQAQFFVTSTNARTYAVDKDVTAEMPNIYSYNPIELE
jgi:GLPGLI family protein